MANQEHLDLLQQSIANWNTWRKQHPDIQPDFGEADLRYADLSYADLHSADLSYADLAHANLSNTWPHSCCQSHKKQRIKARASRHLQELPGLLHCQHLPLIPRQEEDQPTLPHYAQ